MTNFTSKGYDFHLAVTTTEAYLAAANFHNDPSLTPFRDGVGTTTTGVFDILPTTLNLIPTFVTNASLGTTGSGDERAFSSFQAALNDPTNAGFLRPSSFMAMIILSDEDDFSSTSRVEYSWTNLGGVPDHDYTYANLDPVDNYISYLDGLTNTTGALRRYSVSAIAVLDADCMAAHVAESPATVIGQRYMTMATATNGIVGSVCDTSYAASLTAIQAQIISLGTQFFLNGSPIPSTIVVDVDGVVVPPDPTNGWTYNSAANSIVFHGVAVPLAGATISVNFDPSKLTF
jgi:hypothetical protein